MIKRAAVVRIDEYRAVVAPARAGAGTGLMARGRRHDRFALRHIVRRIGGEPAGESNPGVSGRTGGAVADDDVALAVHVDAGHPTPDSVPAAVEALLLGGHCRDGISGHVKLVPANGRRPG